VNQAIAFYKDALASSASSSSAAMAILARGDLTLWLAGPAAFRLQKPNSGRPQADPVG